MASMIRHPTPGPTPDPTAGARLSIRAAARLVPCHHSTLAEHVRHGAVRSHDGKVVLREVLEDLANNIDLSRSHRRKAATSDNAPREPMVGLSGEAPYVTFDPDDLEHWADLVEAAIRRSGDSDQVTLTEFNGEVIYRADAEALVRTYQGGGLEENLKSLRDLHHRLGITELPVVRVRLSEIAEHFANST